MDAIIRREHLETSENPDTKIDYLVTLSEAISTACQVEIRYIPDFALLKPASLQTYLAALGRMDWSTLEALGLTILNDLNNELVARWVQVRLSGTSAGLTHRVTLEDRQPRWDNAALLARINSL